MYNYFYHPFLNCVKKGHDAIMVLVIIYILNLNTSRNKIQPFAPSEDKRKTYIARFQIRLALHEESNTSSSIEHYEA